ncbi:hypothetical protein [Clostridium baratii]|uniref:ParB/Spo0J HTH domain-containing protein n=1 Tax=Clostridium baratii TaxID=1561 RepID=A0A174QVL7_9CLOT|nr:hypothetical protein [Clostridium baratii]CUP74915.1 Uncharacterised protein [Clostridium baratii]
MADGDNLNLATQKYLAEELNISQRQLADYKKLTNLIPELQQMIENNPMKQSRVISEYERLCGIKRGNPQLLNNSTIKNRITQSDIAKQLGIDRTQLINLKKLQDLIPELQQMIENGSMKATVGYKIWAKMPQGEQEKFFNDRVSLRNSVLKRY